MKVFLIVCFALKFATFANCTERLRIHSPIQPFCSAGGLRTLRIMHQTTPPLPVLAPVLHFTEMVLPPLSNHYGTLFAGQALALMSKAAFVTASRHAGHDVVMARCGQVDFLAPVPQGRALELSSQVVRCGRSSMSVQVTGLMAPQRSDTAPVEVLRGMFEMVCVDAQGRPQPLAH
jgi:acyl-CoA hydrolase